MRLKARAAPIRHHRRMISTASTLPLSGPHSIRAVVMPREHGSWALALEPVALGLLVAPSPGGGWLALAVAAGFLVRRPLKLAWTLPPTEARRGTAACATMILAVAAGLALLAAGGLFGAPEPTGRAAALWPLLLAAPLGAAFLWFDLRHAMREAEAELAGSAAFACVPAAFATLAGWSAPAALGLAVLMLARSVPTVLTVRCYLRLQKRQPTAPAGAIAAALFAVFAVAGSQGVLPAAAVLLPAVLLVRTVVFVTPLRPAWSAKQVGMLEAVLGVAYVAAAAAIFHAA